MVYRIQNSGLPHKGELSKNVFALVLGWGLELTVAEETHCRVTNPGYQKVPKVPAQSEPWMSTTVIIRPTDYSPVNLFLIKFLVFVNS